MENGENQEEEEGEVRGMKSCEEEEKESQFSRVELS